MAETYTNHGLDVTNSETDIYSNTSGGIAVLVSLRITNVNGSSADQITAKITNSSNTKIAHISYEMDVPADTSVELAGASKIFLENGDKVRLTGTQASGYLEGLASVLEIT
jgi:hypothetical protein